MALGRGAAAGCGAITPAQTLRMERAGECLWPTEELDIGEISRRLLLEHLLWQESERGMVESIRMKQV